MRDEVKVNRTQGVSLIKMACIAGCMIVTSLAYAATPSIKLLSAPLLDPSSNSTVWNYYETQPNPTTHTPGVANWPTAPPEILSLARSLGAARVTSGQLDSDSYANRVYEYVRNNIDVEFRFGLGKGARGAIIDQSGTPFDQANLMVVLLQQAGISASYKVGTIALTAQQFGQWTGLVTNLVQATPPALPTFSVNAAVACQFLADGGIPASCSPASGTLTTVTLAHIWVSATVTPPNSGAVTKVYDPAFKRYNLRSGIDIASGMGCGSDASPTCATLATNASMSTAVAGTIAGSPSLRNLSETQLVTQLQGSSRNLENYVDTNLQDAPLEEVIGGRIVDVTFAPTGVASLPYAATTTKYNWSDIPDPYRTTLRVYKAGLDVTLFADEIAGRRLELTMPTAFSAYAEFLIDDQVKATDSGAAADLTYLFVNHPYAANGGAYADQQSLGPGPGPFVGAGGFGIAKGQVVFGLGKTGAGAPKYFSDREHAQPQKLYNDPNDGTDSSGAGSTLLAAQLLYQESLGLQVIEGVSKTRLTSHHSMGGIDEALIFRSPYFNIESQVSIASTAGDASSRAGAFETAAITVPMLEGSVAAQANDSSAVSGVSCMTASNAAQITFVDATAANSAAVISAIYPHYSTLALFTPETEGYNSIFVGDETNASMFGLICRLAYQPGSVALLSGSGKGGGAGPSVDDPVAAAQNSIKNTDQSLRKRNVLGVDPASGNVNFSPPADLVTGTGEFPYALSFQRTYVAANSNVGTQYSKNEPNGEGRYFGSDKNTVPRIGGGWTHNFQIGAGISNDGVTGLGADRGADAAAAIGGLYTIYGLLRDQDSSTNLSRRLTAVIALQWISQQFTMNAVAVERSTSNTKFVRRLDGTFRPAAGSADRLDQTGNRLGPYETSDDPLSRLFVFSYDAISFKYTDASGAELMFSSPGRYIPTAVPHLVAPPIFRADRWNFPNGVVVNFEYEPIHNNTTAELAVNRRYLKIVSNNLGRSLTFGRRSEVVAGRSDLVDYGLASVRDESNHTVTLTNNCELCSTIDVLAPGQVNPTRYQYATVSAPSGGVLLSRPNYRLTNWYTPDDLNSPFLSVEYDDMFLVKGVVDKGGNRTAYLSAGLYGSENQKRGEIIDASNGATTQYFNLYGKVTATIDALNRTTWNSYDNSRRLKRRTFPEGDSIEYTYDVRSNALTEQPHVKPNSGMSDPPATSTTYNEGAAVYVCSNYKTCNEPATIQDANGKVTSYGYYANGQLASATGPTVTNGVSGNGYSSYGYTLYGGIGSIGGSISLLSSTARRVDGSRNRVINFTYNSGNHLVLQNATVDPGGLNLLMQFTFDAVGNVRTIDGPRSGVDDTTTYFFDAMRRLDYVQAPLGANTTYTYYDDGSLKRIDRDELIGNTVTLRTEQRTYWPTGELMDLTDPAGKVTHYEYDAVGRPLVTTDPDGRHVATVYDVAGQTLCTFKAWTSGSAASAPSAANCNTWNPASYTSLTSPLRYALYSYTNNGKQLAVTDSNNNTTRYQYDGLDRLAFAYFPDPDTGALCGEAAAGGTPSCAGRQTYEKYGYDDNGNRTSLRTRKGDVIASDYDPMNRLWHKSAPGRPQVTYGYYLTGDPLSLSDGAHTVTYDYDNAGRKANETNDGRAVSYLYDEAGNRSRTTWPDADGYFVTYSYDALNRMESVKERDVTELAHYQYDTLSRRQSLTLGGNASNAVSYGYEPNSLLSTLNHLMGSSVNFTYGHNNSGQITRIDASEDFYLSVPSVKNVGYMTNKLNQYVGVGAFTNDSNGNPIVTAAYSGKKWVTIPIDDLSIVIPVKGKPGATPDANQADPGGDSLVHDLNGNLLRWTSTVNGVTGRNTYTYDSENRLRTAAVSGSTTAGISYDYDPLGRRISKTVNGTMTRYLLDGDEEIGEYDSSWNLQRRYLTGPAIDDRIATLDGGGTKSYYHVNHQGSVMAMTDGNGSLGDRYAYDEYGNLTAGNANGQPFRYTGRRYDNETGLYYYRARYYTPVLGRFLQTDPIGYKDDLDLYAYVGNDPVDHVDPNGADSVPVTPEFIASRQNSHLTAEDIEDFQIFVGEMSGIYDAADAFQDARDGNYKNAAIQAGMALGGKYIKPVKGAYKIVTKSYWYVGKGTMERMKASIRRIEKQVEGKIKNAKFNKSKVNTDKQALKDEDKLIQKSGGIGDPKSLNQRESPGKKLNEKDRQGKGNKDKKPDDMDEPS